MLCKYLIIFLCVIITPRVLSTNDGRTITFENGYPSQYVSGSIHYFRVHPTDWRDRLRKMKWAGLHAIQTYIEWASHEPEPGVYDFSGGLNLTHFLQTSKEEGLSVILRPGPFICAERDMGGLPYWLLRLNPDVKLRTSDNEFMKYVRRWFKVLFPLVRPFMHDKGGPVAMVQVENEYGSIDNCDFEYLTELVNLFKDNLGNSTFLFSTDNGRTNALRCAKVPSLFATVDFGPEVDPVPEFRAQRLFEEAGPLINSEFYTGWIDHWGEPHHTKTSQVVGSAFDKLLQMGASVNFYMFHGGTSFGLASGATAWPRFQACPTSYDYDAPISEAGDLTPKYFEIKKVIQKYFPVPSGPSPPSKPKGNYGFVEMSPSVSLFDMLPYIRHSDFTHTKTFEELGVNNGLVVYETVIPTSISSPSRLDLFNTHDRGYVFLNRSYIGLVSRERDMYTISLSATPGQVVSVVVESQGHTNSKSNDFKGILSAPTINGHPLTKWRMTPVPVQNFTAIWASIMKGKNGIRTNRLDSRGRKDIRQMKFFHGGFTIPDQPSQPMDTFLKTEMFTKGYVWINDFLLGRYWPVMGPQLTLYVPHGILHRGINAMLILELEATTQKDNLTVLLTNTAEINGPTPVSLFRDKNSHGLKKGEDTDWIA